MSPDALLAELPLVAILRGVTPARIEAVAGALFEAGIRAIEVPLNSPEPFKSIEILAKTYGDRCLTGAGTVLDPADVDRLVNVGGRLLVTPNTNPAVIARGVEKKLVVMPGFYTPSEAFAAIAAGAKILKLFPAATAGTGHLKAMMVVLPPDIPVYAVGGVGAGNMKEWRWAGAAGFGMGSDLFKPDFSDEEIATRARQSVAAFKAAS
jgi:2-dehydro-3-deoxyphosphogalactonate aldolase